MIDRCSQFQSQDSWHPPFPVFLARTRSSTAIQRDISSTDEFSSLTDQEAIELESFYTIDTSGEKFLTSDELERRDWREHKGEQYCHYVHANRSHVEHHPRRDEYALISARAGSFNFRDLKNHNERMRAMSCTMEDSVKSLSSRNANASRLN